MPPVRRAAGASNRPVAKAGTDMVAVYDQSGRLVGMVAPNKIAPVQQAGGSDFNAVPKRMAEDGNIAAQAAVDEIAKALSSARFIDRPQENLGTVAVAKSSGRVVDVFETVVKSLDARSAKNLTDAVALVALRLTSPGVPASRAVQIAKRAAVEMAQHRARTAPRSDRDVIAEIRRRIARPR